MYSGILHTHTHSQSHNNRQNLEFIQANCLQTVTEKKKKKTTTTTAAANIYK